MAPLEAFAIMAEEDDIVDVGGDGAPAIRGAWRDPPRGGALIADGDEMPPARTVVLSCRKGDASAVASTCSPSTCAPPARRAAALRRGRLRGVAAEPADGGRAEAAV